MKEKSLRDGIFIKRPHAVTQFRERAGYSHDYPFDQAEDELRKEAAKQIEDGKVFRNKTDRDREFVVRIAIPGKDVVFALVEVGVPDGNYAYLIHTVYTKEMYDQWNDEGKLGTFGDLPIAEALKDVKLATTDKEWSKQENGGDPAKRLIRWQDSDGRFDSKWTTKDNVSREIYALLAEGVKLDTIEIFRKVAFDLTITLGD